MHTRVRRLLAVVAALVAPCFSHARVGAIFDAPVTIAAPPELVVGGGAMGVLDTEQLALGFVQLRLGHEWHGLRPWVGADFIEGGAFWVGLGVRYEIDLHDRYRVTMSFAPGYFEDGNVLNLGKSIEFVSTFEISARIGRGRIGASFGHISNGGLGELNPGSEITRIFFTLPLGR